MNGKRRLGRHKTSYSSNITQWMADSMEQISRDRAGWRILVRCAARANFIQVQLHNSSLSRHVALSSEYLLMSASLLSC